jgi:hypothetical protein
LECGEVVVEPQEQPIRLNVKVVTVVELVPHPEGQTLVVCYCLVSTVEQFAIVGLVRCNLANIDVVRDIMAWCEIRL